MDVIAESTARVFGRREKISGLKMVYEPKYLHFFQVRFEKLTVKPVNGSTVNRKISSAAAV